MSEDRIFVNGHPANQVSALDRGLQYGDGLFETMALINGELPLWRYHMERLISSCERLFLPVPDEELLLNEVNLLSDNYSSGVIKLVITRGKGTRGYRLPDNQEPERILYYFPVTKMPVEHWQSGISTKVCKMTLGWQPRLAGIKHLNRLEQVLAASELQDEQIDEGLLCDYQGHIIEALSHNVFMVKNGELLTPSLQRCGVEGVMRKFVLELAKQENIPYKISDITMDELHSMDEVFLTNSVHGIWPVRKIKKQDYPIGPMTIQLSEKVADILPYN